MNTLLLIPSKESVGLTSACLGLIYALDCNGVKSGFFKPFEKEKQQTTDLYEKLFQDTPALSIDYEKFLYALNHDQIDELLEDAVSQHRKIAAGRDIVIVEGLPPAPHLYSSYDLNLQLAKALDAKILLVSDADLQAPEATAVSIDASYKALDITGRNRVAGVLLMRTKGLPEQSAQIPVTLDSSLRLVQETKHFTRALQQYSQHIGQAHLPVVGLVPFSNTLSVPRTADILDAIEGTWINEGEAQQRRILHTSLVSSDVAYELNKLTAGELIVSSTERHDILLASCLATQQGTPLAGLILSEREQPQAAVLEFCDPTLQLGLPIIHTPLNPIETIQRLHQFSLEISIHDIERAKQITRFVSSHIDEEWLAHYVKKSHQVRLSPAAFRYELVQQAIQAKKRIVLPEGDEPRTIEAAIICQTRGLAQCVLLAKPDDVHKVASARHLTIPADLEIIDPEFIRHQYVDQMVALRRGKLAAAQAKEQLQDTVVLGTMMLALDEVDGLVSGAVHTTANTVRPAFQLIKTAPAYSLVSSVFFMLLPDEVFVYGDCAINPNPNAEQLAEIAIQSADSAKAFGIEPRIAMISYSTGASGMGTDVEKVLQATTLVKERRPDLLVDGPLQYDAASVESVGKSKAPDSKVAGQANVYIFPDLNTGNTTYKAVQRSANVVSVGPMLQGLNKPVNDLSRGALVDDIVFTIALTAIQAQAPK